MAQDETVVTKVCSPAGRTDDWKKTKGRCSIDVFGALNDSLGRRSRVYVDMMGTVIFGSTLPKTVIDVPILSQPVSSST